MSTKRKSPLDYAFSVGKIRALEKFLIPREAFEEAIDAELPDALRLFVESNLYSDDLLHVKTSRDLEAVLSRATLDLKKQVAELILDKELLGLLDLDGKKCVDYLLKQYQSVFFEDYIRHLIDMHNIKTFLRLFILKEPLGALEERLICDGFIKKETFLKSYTQGLVVFVNRLEYVHRRSEVLDYAYFLREAIEKAGFQKSFVSLEKAMHDFLIEILKPAKLITFGPEPVIAYYFAKINEINLVRMVILAKLNDLGSALVRERLNAVYA